MATSSIFAHVEITDQEKAEQFVAALEEAMKMLKIDPSEREMYKQLVEQIQAENKE